MNSRIFNRNKYMKPQVANGTNHLGMFLDDMRHKNKINRKTEIMREMITSASKINVAAA